jgi:heptosyltransferase-3
MTIERFIQLWTHRYHKYSHIGKAHLKAYKNRRKFQKIKSNLKPGQPLIALIRTEHFGDIVAAEPLVRYVKSIHPNAYIVWFVKPVFRELVDNNPNIDAVHPEFCVTERRLLMESGVFDQVFQLQFRNNNECSRCQVFLDNPLAVTRNINVMNYFNYGNLLEVFAKMSGLIEMDAEFPGDQRPKLYIGQQQITKVDALHLPKKFIVIHTQSNYAPKDWPKERWNLLVDWLTMDKKMHVVEIGLKSNLEVSSALYTNLCGALSIMETAEVIGRADYFIGLDSGPSHLANAMGTFGMILMGSLNEFPSYNPYSGSFGTQENAKFIRKSGFPCAQMSFEYVKGEVVSILGA